MKHVGLTLASLALLSAAEAQAFEPTGDEIADAFLRAYTSELVDVTSVGAVTREDGSVRIEGLSATNRGRLGSNEQPFDMTLEGVTIDGGRLADEVLVADRITVERQLVQMDGVDDVPAIRLDYDDIVFVEPEVTAGSYVAASLGELSFLANGTSGSTGSVHVAAADAVTLSIDGSRWDYTVDTSGDAAVVEVTVAADGMTLTGPALDEPTASIRQALGVPRIAFDISGAFGWAEEGGRVTFDPYRVEADGIGTVIVHGELGGFTPKLWEAMDTAVADDTRVAATLADLTLSHLTVEVIDGGAIDALIDTLGASGTPPAAAEAVIIETLIAQLATPFAMVDEGELRGAVERFVTERGALEVAVEFEEPMPLVPTATGDAPEVKVRLKAR